LQTLEYVKRSGQHGDVFVVQVSVLYSQQGVRLCPVYVSLNIWEKGFRKINWDKSLLPYQECLGKKYPQGKPYFSGTRFYYFGNATSNVNSI